MLLKFKVKLNKTIRTLLMLRMLRKSGLGLAMIVAGCQTQPGDAPGLEKVLGASLSGTIGKTRADQERIDIRIARECAAGFWKDACK